jgi:hypothetical protein
VPILIGWLLGVAVGGVVAGAIIAALALSLASAVIAWILAIFLLSLFYLLGYTVATLSLSGALPVVTFPLAANVPTPGGVPVALPAIPGELFARGLMIGLTAALNAAALSLIPRFGPFLGAWAFTVVSLAAIIFVARNRVFQGFLGWSAWLLPMSYFATAIGLVLFLVNAPFAFAARGIGAFALDFTTGVIETAGGTPIGLTGFPGGFSLGNFTFITPAGIAIGVVPASFLSSSVSSHETGHSLNTAAMGGIVLWINAIDENIAPKRMNLAYGELTAEGHAQVVPPPLRASFFVRLWA